MFDKDKKEEEILKFISKLDQYKKDGGSNNYFLKLEPEILRSNTPQLSLWFILNVISANLFEHVKIICASQNWQVIKELIKLPFVFSNPYLPLLSTTIISGKDPETNFEMLLRELKNAEADFEIVYQYYKNVMDSSNNHYIKRLLNVSGLEDYKIKYNLEKQEEQMTQLIRDINNEFASNS